ncbi:hypothetical protein [Caproiciproducens sp.]
MYRKTVRRRKIVQDKAESAASKIYNNFGLRSFIDCLNEKTCPLQRLFSL